MLQLSPVLVCTPVCITLPVMTARAHTSCHVTLVWVHFSNKAPSPKNNTFLDCVKSVSDSQDNYPAEGRLSLDFACTVTV